MIEEKKNDKKRSFDEEDVFVHSQKHLGYGKNDVDTTTSTVKKQKKNKDKKKVAASVVNNADDDDTDDDSESD